MHSNNTVYQLEVRANSKDKVRPIHGVSHHPSHHRLPSRSSQLISNGNRGNTAQDDLSGSNQDRPDQTNLAVSSSGTTMALLSLLFLVISPFLILINWLATLISGIMGLALFHQVRAGSLSNWYHHTVVKFKDDKR